jgi:hypothetical protein
MTGIKLVEKIAGEVGKVRRELGYGDKTLKVTSYVGLLLLQFVDRGGRVGLIAGWASKVGRLRVFIWTAFSVQDFHHLGKCLHGSVTASKKPSSGGEANNVKLLSFDMGTNIAIVAFEMSYVGGAALSFSPLTRGLATWLRQPIGHLIIILDTLGIIAVYRDTQWNKTRSRDTADYFDVSDGVCDIACTALEMTDRSGVASAALGASSGVCNIVANVLKTRAER